MRAATAHSFVSRAAAVVPKRFAGALRRSDSVFGFRQLFPVMALCLGISGCGGDMDVAPVSGTVTLDGQPLDRASVLFEPENGRPSYGVTDGRGRYRLLYTRDQDGAEVGECRVKISTLMQPEGPSAPKPAERVPQRYAKDPIRVVVEAKRNTIDIELSSRP